MRRRRHALAKLGLASTMLVSTVIGVGPAVAGAPSELPSYRVVKSGLTADEARALGSAFELPAAWDTDTSFRYASDDLGLVPVTRADGSALPPDEDGQTITTEAFDLPAIQRLQPISGDAAARLAMAGFDQAGVAVPGSFTMMPSNTMLKIQSLDKATSLSKAIDTTVGFSFMLGEYPLTGPGQKVRMTFDTNGKVTELIFAARTLEMGEMVTISPIKAAKRACQQHYPVGSRLQTPRIVYWAPPLETMAATIYPHWQCGGVTPTGETLVPAVIPAVPDMSPAPRIITAAEGSKITADGSVRGGTPPYAYSWQSLTTDLDEKLSGEPSIAYEVMPRDPVGTETLWLTVTDANGLVGSARALIPLGTVARPPAAPARPAAAESLGRLDVGGEFNVYDWQCTKDTSSGFASVFGSKGVPVSFRWNGLSSWEQDFRESASPQSGDDASYVDDVDLAWYTGHGSPSKFTFDNANHDDDRIVPADANWGNRDLEFLQLESCQVLAFSSGGVPIWDRWSKTLDGLHLLNGFQTVASCITGGTAGDFAAYLFPRNYVWGTLPALRVRQAWALMAHDLEPAGTQYVSMGAIGPNDITTINDYFWGQGPVGPDIPRSQITGYWWLVGTV